MHNVNLDRIRETQTKAKNDPAAAMLNIDLKGDWRGNPTQPQFGGRVKFAKGEMMLEGDFPPFLGGAGRTPSPLTYCFFGAMCCYGATFAMQAAMAGIELEGLHIGLKLTVDFRTALELGQTPPLSPFEFEVEVETKATDADVQRVKKLADERCPAIWAMDNQVPYSTRARRVAAATA